MKNCENCGVKDCILLPENCKRDGRNNWIPKQEESQQEQVREWIDQQNKKLGDKSSEIHYTEDSVVAKKKQRIDSLVKAHWKYQENVISVGQDKEQLFTWEQVLAIREWDYCSSAKHFYGHGYEDAHTDMEAQNIKSFDMVRSHYEHH